MNQNNQNRNYLEELQNKFDEKPFHVNLKALGIEQTENCMCEDLGITALDSEYFKIFCIQCGKVHEINRRNKNDNIFGESLGMH